MKKPLFSFLILSMLSFQLLHAQTEIKFSPIALLATIGAISVEHGFNDDFGMEADVYFAGGGGALIVSAKYYFNPKEGLDRFHAGIYTGIIPEAGAGIGFLAGTKIVSQKNILFEIGLGVGRTFEGGFLPYAKLHIGYRFGGR